jgi:cytoskeletal protein RodZ
MNSIGERLRQERLRRGFDLNQIAELTKISPIMLEAIEADDFDRLPGSFFARSFVRQYAQALGLDEDEFEAELRRVAGFGHPAEAPAGIPEIVAGPAPLPAARGGPNRHPLGSLVLLVVIFAACTGIYSLWQKTRSTSAKAQPAPVASPANPVPSPSPSPTPPPADTPSPSPEPTAEPAETPAAEPLPTPEPVAAPAEQTAGIRLELRATAEAWVRVISDGKTVYSGVLQPNEARVFEGADSMILRAGNAGALAATYNGKPLGELGPEGQVRTIQFTPSGFQFLTPAQSPTPSAEQP